MAKNSHLLHKWVGGANVWTLSTFTLNVLNVQTFAPPARTLVQEGRKCGQWARSGFFRVFKQTSKLICFCFVLIGIDFYLLIARNLSLTTAAYHGFTVEFFYNFTQRHSKCLWFQSHQEEVSNKLIYVMRIENEFISLCMYKYVWTHSTM